MKIEDIKGLGPKKAQLFYATGIKTPLDILNHFPARYEDRRTITPITELKEGENALIRGSVTEIRKDKRRWGKKQVLKVYIEDDTGMIELVFFNGYYLDRAFKLHENFYCYGKMSVGMGKRQMIHPEFFKDDVGAELTIVPVYSLPHGISQRDMRNFVRYIFSDSEFMSALQDPLPHEFSAKYELLGLEDSLRKIHFPANFNDTKAANKRFIYEEMLLIHLGLMMMQEPVSKGVAIIGDEDIYYEKADSGASTDVKAELAKDKCEFEGAGLFQSAPEIKEYMESLPFELTKAQERSVHEIISDMKADFPMNRLLQGDVGSGKTAVAEIAMYYAAKNGFQSAYMAPTELLAVQQYEGLKKRFEQFGYKVSHLLGSMSKSEKDEVKRGLISGDTDVVIGTHALIQDEVEFFRPGLVITDEQHRFGVRQRAVLKNKGKNPNCLVMSATPIPRTLAMVLFGDMQISVIDELPKGKKAIETKAVTGKSRDAVYAFAEEEMSKGRQIYVVTPLIESSDALEKVRSAEEVYAELLKRFPNRQVALLHGAMKPDEKADIMKRYAKGSIDLLVSTVVIEVGINVPNATVMIIENAERFGLSQLHQLRGRVGRGEKQSYCVLILESKSEMALARAKTLTESTDGFYIAEKDLELRGPGEVFGQRQHGAISDRLKNLIAHMDVFEKIKGDAKSILDEHPGLADDESMLLKQRVDDIFEAGSAMTL